MDEEEAPALAVGLGVRPGLGELVEDGVSGLVDGRAAARHAAATEPAEAAPAAAVVDVCKPLFVVGQGGQVGQFL